ncbi:MAG: hypothetical protein K9J74_06745 [Sulfuritalea sp.]|nr:hypothetical protein [Sulfuritalea sp.]
MKFWMSALAAIAAFVFAAPALAAPCDEVLREMTYGETAVEAAKTQADFLKAAEQFKAAARKAPKCASAAFNLGVTLEKAEHYLSAKEAYETYLKLAPQADDAAAVRKQIFRMEYLAENSTSKPSGGMSRSGWGHIAGKWCSVGQKGKHCDGTVRQEHGGGVWVNTTNTPYQISVIDGTIKIVQTTKSVSSYHPRCVRPTQQTFEGTIDADGNMRGSYEVTTDARCEGGGMATAKGSFSGRVLANGELIEVTTKGANNYGGGAITSQLNRR